MLTPPIPFVRQFVKLTSSWPPARVEVGLLTALDATTSAGQSGKYEKAVFWIQFREIDTFLGKARPIFNEIANVAQGLPKRTPEDDQRDPKGTPRKPKGQNRVHKTNIPWKIHYDDSSKEN